MFRYLPAGRCCAVITILYNKTKQVITMSTGKTLLALALSALLPAGAAWAANNDTIIYCSEASPESFNPQIASSGPSFVASSQVLYNRTLTTSAWIS